MPALLPINYPCFVTLTAMGAPNLMHTKDGTLALAVLFHLPEQTSDKPIRFDDPVSLCWYANKMRLSKLSFDLDNGTMFTVSTTDFLRQSSLDPGTN